MRVTRLISMRLGAALIAVVPLLVLTGCGGGFEKKSTDELIAIVKDASIDAGTLSLGDGRWTSGSRCDAAGYLGRQKATAAVDVLIPLLRDGQMDACAVDALGAIGDGRAVGPLLEAMADSAVDEQGNVREEACVDRNDPSVCLYRLWVTDALLQIGPAAVDQLISVVDTPYREAVPAPGELAKREVAIRALAFIGDKRAGAIFIDWLPGEAKLGPVGQGFPSEVLARMYPVGKGLDPTEVLARMYADAVDDLLPLLQSKETVYIAVSIIAIGKPGTEEALIDGLMQFGDETLAEVYLNSGNGRLKAAAGDWAVANGYTVKLNPGGGSTTEWGSLPGTP